MLWKRASRYDDIHRAPNDWVFSAEKKNQCWMIGGYPSSMPYWRTPRLKTGHVVAKSSVQFPHHRLMVPLVEIPTD